MKFWWVSQNKTYNEEKNGGFLWAPKKNKNLKTFFHWKTMEDIEIGDIIFSYVNQKIVAYSIAKTHAYDFDKPFENEEELWEKKGLKVDVEYKVLDKPILIEDIRSDLEKLFEKQDKYKPLNKNGIGNQGYLFPLIDEVGKYLLNLCENKK